VKRASKLLLVIGLLAFLLLFTALPARAFDGRAGGTVLVKAGETIEDDLYVTAGTFILDGTVHGDVIAVGRTITIDGRIDGDLIAIGQTVRVNGAVSGAIRTAGFALLLDEQARSGGDLIAAGYSLEIRPGSEVGKDLLYAGGQLLLAGEVERHAHVSARAFELRGAVGGSVAAGVGEAGAANPAGWFTRLIPASPLSPPPVQPGLTVAQGARVGGDLAYRQTRELAIPAGVVAGETLRNPPAGAAAAEAQTAGGRLLSWAVDLLRLGLSLILFGLFLLWLFPRLVQGMGEALRTAALPSLGWGVAAGALFALLLLLVLLATAAGGLIFSLLSLGGLAGAVIAAGVLVLLALLLGFVLLASFVAKIVFGQALGRWLLARLGSPLAGHRYWPMLIGVALLAPALALLALPAVPGFVGALVNVALLLFALGALWLWARGRLAPRRAYA